MKDCEPRDWPHLPDSRANERPHWIIPHNAFGTKAQQLTLERHRKMKREGGREGGSEAVWGELELDKVEGGANSLGSLLVRRRLSHRHTHNSHVLAKQRLVGQE